MDKIQLLLVDDQKLFIESLKNVIERTDRSIEVIGVAHDGSQALELLKKNKPDIILMDVQMPNMDGVQATRNILNQYPDIKIVMLTTFDDDDYVRDALNYGAIGYLLKENIMPEDLVNTIKLVKNGTFMMSPGIAEKIIKKSYYFDNYSQESMPEKLLKMNHNEKRILKLMMHGYDNIDIADQTCLANQTVKNYVSSIYNKLGVSNRAEAIRIGIEMFHNGLDFPDK